MTSITSTYQVIIVGGGLSGMAAAKWLHETGVSVLVLEAENRLGGRTYTKKVPEVDYVDLGGAYLGPGQKHVLRLARDLNVEKYAIDGVTGSTIFYDASKKRRQIDEPSIWNPFVMLDVNNFFRSLETLGKEIPLNAPWEAPHAEEWDQMTVKEYADKVIWTKAMRDILSSFHDVRINVNTHESSFLWFLWHLKQYGSIKRLVSGLGAEKWKFEGGSQQLSEKIADRLGDDRVLLRKPVVGIEQNDKGVIVTTLDGSIYKSDYVIMAFPPALQQKIHFKPSMPSERIQLAQRSPIGCMIKVVIFYEKPFWYETGYNGSIVIKGDNQDDQHPLNIAIDGTKPDGSHASIIGFINTDKSRRLIATTDLDERKKRVVNSLAEVFNDKRFLKPLIYEEMNWASQQYTGGCGMTVLPPGALTTYGRILREPVGRLFFAGTETAAAWSGHMDGAVSSGERSARQILHTMNKIPKEQIWSEEPNTEEDEDECDLPFTLIERVLPSVGEIVTIAKTVAWLGVISAAVIIGSAAF